MEENLFSNHQIDIHSLPKVEEVEWTSLHKKYLPISLLNTWFYGVIVMSIFIIINWTNNIIKTPWIFYLILIGIFSILLITTILDILEFKHKAYALREQDILYRSGLIFRKSTVLPFNRVQHSEINQGPIERNFNLSRLQIFTAGGGQSDLVIPGLLFEDAQKINQFIKEKTSDNEQ